MSRLIVCNGYRADLPGLGKIRPLLSLSEKRVSMSVRSELRNRYGFDKVEVECKVVRSSNKWLGGCTIAGKPLKYEVFLTDPLLSEPK